MFERYVDSKDILREWENVLYTETETTAIGIKLWKFELKSPEIIHSNIWRTRRIASNRLWTIFVRGCIWPVTKRMFPVLSFGWWWCSRWTNYGCQTTKSRWSNEIWSAFNTEITSEWLKYGEQISSEKYLIKWDGTHSIRLSCCISLMYIYFRYWNCKYSNRFSGIEENTNIEKKLLIYKQISVSSGEHR